MPPVHLRPRTGRPARFSRTLSPEKKATHSEASSLHQSVDAELLDVTALDIRCLVSINPKIGDGLIFDAKDDSGVMCTVSGIVHWKEIRRHGFEVGLYLPQGLPAAMSNAVTDGRRQSNRYRCRINGQIAFSGQERKCAAAVVNYSHDGFTVRTEGFCKVDQTVMFEWICNDLVWRISGQVLWQIEQHNGVLLGCQTQPGDGYRLTGLEISSQRA